MSPQGLILALLGVLAVAQASVVVALWRRVRTDRAAADRSLDALAERLGRLERRSASNADAGPSRDASAGKRSRRADRPEPSAVAGPTLIAVPDVAAKPATRASGGIVSADLMRRFGAIWELADAGANAPAIARASGLPIGQVELVLGLKRRLSRAVSRSAEGGPRRP